MIGLTPHLTTVAVRAYGVLGLVFEDGLTGDVEVLSRMNGPVFEDARTPEGFLAAQLDVESGTVTWPGGADLAPDTLYERVKTGAWPPRRIAAQLGGLPGTVTVAKRERQRFAITRGWSPQAMRQPW